MRQYSPEWVFLETGIRPEIIRETAREMARGARGACAATYGLATSGIAGPSGGTEEKPVGTVCIGLAAPDRTAGYRFHFWFGNRKMNKQVFAVAALEVLATAHPLASLVDLGESRQGRPILALKLGAVEAMGSWRILGGQHGNARVTVQNLTILRVDAEKNLLYIKGAVPGHPNSLVLIRTAKKVKKSAQ